ncbi:MAG TPA: hypothetical protein VFZ53_19850 [Polyangiaceae bacterium]
MSGSHRVTEVSWEAPHSTLRLRRPARGVVTLIISGTDIGEHGTDPFRELASDLAAEPFDLFVDARASRGVTVDVSSEWSRWLAKNKRSLRSVHMVTRSPFVRLTANFVRTFAELGELMRLYDEPPAFDAALAEAIDHARNAAAH